MIFIIHSCKVKDIVVRGSIIRSSRIRISIIMIIIRPGIVIGITNTIIMGNVVVIIIVVVVRVRDGGAITIGK